MAVGPRVLEAAGLAGSGRLARLREWWEQEHVFGYGLIVPAIVLLAVLVAFPFGMGSLTSSSGIVILLSAMAGSVLTMMAMGVLFALRRLKAGPQASEVEKEAAVFDDDLPPSDYAAKAPEGFDDAPWSRGR